jgi:hypothetical protein
MEEMKTLSAEISEHRSINFVLTQNNFAYSNLDVYGNGFDIVYPHELPSIIKVYSSKYYFQFGRRGTPCSESFSKYVLSTNESNLCVISSSFFLLYILLIISLSHVMNMI